MLEKTNGSHKYIVNYSILLFFLLTLTTVFFLAEVRK